MLTLKVKRNFFFYYFRAVTGMRNNPYLYLSTKMNRVDKSNQWSVRSLLEGGGILSLDLNVLEKTSKRMTKQSKEIHFNINKSNILLKLHII
ncbi:hypothetical protein A9C19_09485 [Bacillus weihaiensis]|uniref:Uncharacterized protein n=1 Tax=Bacillus weihaiensis TaxID=1547283 RepID=A0A1L3MRK8_9BACI|nr:hypothetical protein A9C19_09485 [Bacillus weihaiensis]